MKSLCIFSLLILVFFSACASSGKYQSIADLPKWYSSPKQNSAINLYGVGEGYTVEEATRAALKNLASKLMVSISSESSTLLEENKYGANDESSQKINEIVEKITFTNYVVSNSIQSGEKFYAEILVERDGFITERTQKLAELNKKMGDIYKNLSSKNILEKRNGLADIVQISLEARRIVQILEGLGAPPPGKEKNIAEYDLYQKSYDKILDKIEFYIEAGDTPKSIIKVIGAAISKEKMKIIKTKDSGNLNLVIIAVKSDIAIGNIYGSNIAKLKIDLELLSNTNKVLAKNLIEITGNSVASKEEAINAASSNLAEKIAGEGILKILTLNQ